MIFSCKAFQSRYGGGCGTDVRSSTLSLGGGCWADFHNILVKIVDESRKAAYHKMSSQPLSVAILSNEPNFSSIFQQLWKLFHHVMLFTSFLWYLHGGSSAGNRWSGKHYEPIATKDDWFGL